MKIFSTNPKCHNNRSSIFLFSWNVFLDNHFSGKAASEWLQSDFDFAESHRCRLSFMNVSLDFCHFEIIILDEAGRHTEMKKEVSERWREKERERLPFLLQRFPAVDFEIVFLMKRMMNSQSSTLKNVFNIDIIPHQQSQTYDCFKVNWRKYIFSKNKYFYFPFAYYYCYLYKQNIYGDKILWTRKCMNLIAELIFYVSLLSSFLSSFVS